MSSHDHAGALDELIDEIERAEPAAVDTSSATAIVDSILNSVVPSLLRRVGRINAACERYMLRTGSLWTDGERRINVERDGAELMSVMGQRLKPFTHLIGSDDIQMLADASAAALAGAGGAPALDSVKVYVRIKARAELVTASTAKLMWAIVDAQQDQEKLMSDLALEIATEITTSNTSRHDLMQRVEREGELYRELASRALRIDEWGKYVTREHERIGLEALTTAAATRQYGVALLVLDTICDEIGDAGAHAGDPVTDH